MVARRVAGGCVGGRCSWLLVVVLVVLVVARGTGRAGRCLWLLVLVVVVVLVVFSCACGAVCCLMCECRALLVGLRVVCVFFRHLVVRLV